MKPIIVETKHWKVELNSRDQTYLGRCYVTAQRDVGAMSDLTKEEWIDFAAVVKNLERACVVAFGATMFNWTCLMNLAYQNDPPDPQVHWHFRPRYNGQVIFAEKTFEDTAFGQHYLSGTERKVSNELQARIVQQIQENL